MTLKIFELEKLNLKKEMAIFTVGEKLHDLHGYLGISSIIILTRLPYRKIPTKKKLPKIQRKMQDCYIFNYS